LTLTNYDERTAASYAVARALDAEALAVWRGPIERHLSSARNRTVLDVGAGTGAFASALARWLDARVVAIEPAAAMRSRIVEDPAVRVVAGSAESLPVAPASAAGAWLSAVWHHVPNRATAAASLRAALSEDAPVLIRGIFRDRFDRALPAVRFFPEATQVIKRYPTVEETCAVFAHVGFEPQALDEIVQPVAANLQAVLARIDRRADTLLKGISAEAFDRGRRRLAEAAAVDDAPVSVRMSLLVLR
jgi:SAM-dependent methyltransferase